MTDLTPAAVAMARAACSTLTDAQRLAFAAELTRDVTDQSCVLQLPRLGMMAAETTHELAKARFERECI